MIQITSFTNARFKYFRSLAKSRTRKREGVFIMEGRPELDLAIKSGLSPLSVLYCESYLGLKEIEAIVNVSEVELIHLSKALFDELAYQTIPGNFLMAFRSWNTSIESISKQDVTVIIEAVEKPGNLGAILRTCDAVGIKNVLVTETEVDLFNPNVIRNSRGAVFTVNAVFCTNEQALDLVKTQGAEVYAAVLSGKAVDYKIVANEANKAIVFGAESRGLSSFWFENANHHIIIPMRGVVDSLNVSVSVAVILYEATRNDD
jgi:RNA methyltransferase, TrmH family